MVCSPLSSPLPTARGAIRRDANAYALRATRSWLRCPPWAHNHDRFRSPPRATELALANAAPTGTEAQAASHRCRAGCGVRRRPAPAADPPGCVGGVRRWRFPLTGSTGCVCVPRASSSASAAGSLAPLYYNCTRLYRSKHILTQSNTGKAGPQPSPPGPI